MEADEVRRRWEGMTWNQEERAARFTRVGRKEYPKGMDQECVDLCDALNAFEGVRTVESCCGHGRGPFFVAFEVDTLEALHRVTFWVPEPWRVRVMALNELCFALIGPKNGEAEKLAIWLLRHRGKRLQGKEVCVH